MQMTFEWQSTSDLVDTSAASVGFDAALLQLRGLVEAGRSIEVSPAGVAPLDGSDAMLHCVTSGSTGAPKTIRRTQSSWVRSFQVNGDTLNLSPRDCVAVFGSLAHSLVLYGVLEAAHHGASILGLHGIRPDRQSDHLARQRASVLYLTPTQLGLLCAGGAPVPSVRHILVGGGPLRRALRDQATQVFPNATLTYFYGAAETSFVAWSDHETPPGAVGLPYPDVTFQIRDARDGVGEIWVNSPYLFEGYATGHSSDTRWDNGFLSIGEYGRLDHAGHLYVMGRKSRMVTIADTNVFPEEVETYLAAILGVGGVAVIARPDAVRGHRLEAMVVLSDDSVTADTLLRRCRLDLGPLHAPHRVHLVPTLPMLPAGKPDYAEITKMLEGAA